MESSKLIVSRDVTFAESSFKYPTTEILNEDGKPSNAAVPGGEGEAEVADNIDLSPEDRFVPIPGNRTHNETADSSNSHNNFEHAQQTPDPH